jgi:hypothetical protein
MLCAFASWRLGVKFLCRPDGAENYFGLGFYKYAAPNGAWDGAHKVTRPYHGATPKTATGTGALPSKDPMGGRVPGWPAAKTRPKAVWGGRTGQRAFEYAQ